MIPNNHSSTSETTSFFSFPPFFPIFNHGSPIFISIPVKSGAIQIKRVVNDGYPLVNQHNHENHYFSWVNQLFLWSFSIAFCMFTRGYYPAFSHGIREFPPPSPQFFCGQNTVVSGSPKSCANCAAWEVASLPNLVMSRILWKNGDFMGI